MKFQNNVSIVTGSAQGIGQKIAENLVSEGAKVVITDINQEACQQLAEKLKKINEDVLYVVGDVSNANDVKNVIDQTVENFGRIDILVNNAGIVKDSRLKEMEEANWDQVINVCLKGAFLFSKYASTHMAKQSYGKIVNISSRAHLGNPGQANYSSAKAGVVGLTKSLAKELGKKNINVNAIAPGLVDTEALKNHPKYEKIKKLQKKETPLQRIGQKDDVANAVLF